MILVNPASLKHSQKARLNRDEIIAQAKLVLPDNCHHPAYRGMFQEQYDKGFVAVCWPDGYGAFVPNTLPFPDPEALFQAYEEVRDEVENAYSCFARPGKPCSSRKRR